MRFSTRTGWDLRETAWAETLRRMRAVGETVFDLTASNPARCGFSYDADSVLRPLRDAAALDYDPDPRGMPRAREAVSRYYAEHGADVKPERIFLTTGTSEAYSFLFRLLCDPADEVLIAEPGYPLFDFLAALDDVQLTPFAYFYDHGWHLDEEALRSRIGPRTRAVAVVHPNNPTGHFIKGGERTALGQICREHGLALIVDEVFLDFPLGQRMEEPSFAMGEAAALTFVLSGLSKIAGLPQMKASWIACLGPEDAVAEAAARLEVIADTFLSMNAPVQCALPAWLAGRHSLQEQIRARTAGNLAALDEILARQTLVTRLEVEAGWYAVLRTPAVEASDDLAVALLTGERVVVHSGRFFGFPEAGYLVVSLLPESAVFREGAGRLVTFVDRRKEGIRVVTNTRE